MHTYGVLFYFICVCVYIYIYRERESWDLVCMYIYVWNSTLFMGCSHDQPHTQTPRA